MEVRRKIYMLYMLFPGLAGSFRIVKNCDRGLENAARGRTKTLDKGRCFKEQIYFDLLYDGCI